VALGGDARLAAGGCGHPSDQPPRPDHHVQQPAARQAEIPHSTVRTDPCDPRLENLVAWTIPPIVLQIALLVSKPSQFAWRSNPARWSRVVLPLTWPLSPGPSTRPIAKGLVRAGVRACWYSFPWRRARDPTRREGRHPVAAVKTGSAVPPVQSEPSLAHPLLTYGDCPTQVQRDASHVSNADRDTPRPDCPTRCNCSWTRMPGC
jgi:hypothetical protein